MFYVYIIYSAKSDIYYVGHSHDPKRRLIAHNESPRNTFTSKHRPWELKASIPVSENRGEAIKLEKYIKSVKKRNFIESLIQNQNNEPFIEELKKTYSTGSSSVIGGTGSSPGGRANSKRSANRWPFLVPPFYNCL